MLRLNEPDIRYRLGLIGLGLLIVLGVVAGAVVGMGWTYNRFVPYNQSFEKRLRIFARHQQDIEILFMGASGVSRGLDPAEFRPKAFNLAEPAENYAIIYLKLKTFISQMPKLKMVLLPVSFGNFSSFLMGWNEVPESTLTADRAFFDGLPLKLAPSLRWPQASDGIFPILSRKQLEVRTAEALKELFPGISTGFLKLGMIKSGPVNPENGYVYSLESDVTPFNVGRMAFKIVGKGSAIDPEAVKFFKKTIHLCQQHGIRVVTIGTPLTDLFINIARKYVTMEDVYGATLKDPAVAPHVLAHYDFIRLFPTQYEYFEDGNHVNRRGARILSRKLAARLSEHF